MAPFRWQDPGPGDTTAHEQSLMGSHHTQRKLSG